MIVECIGCFDDHVPTFIQMVSQCVITNQGEHLLLNSDCGILSDHTVRVNDIASKLLTLAATEVQLDEALEEHDLLYLIDKDLIALSYKVIDHIMLLYGFDKFLELSFLYGNTHPILMKGNMSNDYFRQYGSNSFIPGLPKRNTTQPLRASQGVVYIGPRYRIFV